jgi:transposase
MQKKRLHSGVSYKRLKQDRFAWPRQQAVMTLTVEQLHWLLEGIDIEAIHRHPTRINQHIG